MASFSETATLSVIDNSSKQISKINAELKKLMATAKSLKSSRFDISANLKGLNKAQATSGALHPI
jgi:hypothetical protein